MLFFFPGKYAVRITETVPADGDRQHAKARAQIARHKLHGRDIAAMAAARHIASEPAWFVDAQAENPAPPAAQAPVPGLTVIAFPNNHLSYALTWFALCALSLGLAVFIGRGRL